MNNNYKFDYKLTYSIKDEEINDTFYRKDIIHVFNLTNFFNSEKINDELFFKKLSDNVHNMYLKYKEHKQISIILKKIKENLRFPFELTNDMLFMYLFRYDLFYYFHNCLIDLNKENIISEPNFKLLINSI